MDSNGVIEIVSRVVVPILTLLGGWFGHMFRTKQKKEQDILANVQQILKMQKAYIEDQDAQNKKNCDMIARLERKLDDKNKSIRQANRCEFTAEGEGCPVLNHEDLLEERCKTCELNKDANGED